MLRLFIPGFAARAAFYRKALGEEWAIHEPPPIRRRCLVEERVEAVCAELDRTSGPVTIGGHSLGAALAACAAVRRSDRIERVVLVNPAGLPLTKPVRASLVEFAGQVAARTYPAGALFRACGDALIAPRRTYELMQAVRALDLRATFRRLAELGIPCDVVGCVGDTLTPTSHTRAIAALTAGRHHELTAAGGHVWMLVDPSAFAAVAL